MGSVGLANLAWMWGLCVDAGRPLAARFCEHWALGAVCVVWLLLLPVWLAICLLSVEDGDKYLY